MIDLLAPDAAAQFAALHAEIAAERLVTVRATIARIEEGRAKAVGEIPAGPELDAWLVPVDGDLARLRVELAATTIGRAWADRVIANRDPAAVYPGTVHGPGREPWPYDWHSARDEMEDAGAAPTNDEARACCAAASVRWAEVVSPHLLAAAESVLEDLLAAACGRAS